MLREELGGKELTIEELLTQPFSLPSRITIAVYSTAVLPRGGPSLRRRSSAVIPRCSFACLRLTAVYPSAVVRGREQRKRGKLIRLSVEDCYISLYRQIFSHKEKWRTREMDEFVRVAKLADEEE